MRVCRATTRGPCFERLTVAALRGHGREQKEISRFVGRDGHRHIGLETAPFLWRYPPADSAGRIAAEALQPVSGFFGPRLSQESGSP